MTPAAKLSAAIELIEAIDTQRVPAAKALKEWGTAHRYAGSGDRAGIAGLVWDVLRRRASSAWIMNSDTPRARVLGMLKAERKMDVEAIAALCDGGRFSPEPLSDAEHAALSSRSVEDAPAHIAGDYPEWLDGHLTAVFGDDRVAEATAMASRAPLDLRVNTLKAKREKVLGSVKHLGAGETPWSPMGLRIDLGADARNPGIQAEEDFIKGAIEVQDEGSQLAALLSGAKPGEQVIDLCAGAGGKTLALAAMMQGKGRLIATDSDKRQLAPIHERLSRAGVHNCDISVIARSHLGCDEAIQFFARYWRAKRLTCGLRRSNLDCRVASLLAMTVDRVVQGCHLPAFRACDAAGSRVMARYDSPQQNLRLAVRSVAACGRGP
jgi:16S rRNA (cytosine967-C5)-methyltransferase